MISGYGHKNTNNYQKVPYILKIVKKRMVEENQELKVMQEEWELEEKRILNETDSFRGKVVSIELEIQKMKKKIEDVGLNFFLFLCSNFSSITRLLHYKLYHLQLG